MEKEIKINRFYFKKENHQTLFRFKSLGRDENANVALESIKKDFPQANDLEVEHLLNSICVICDASDVYTTINIHDDNKATDLISKLSTNPYFTELITSAVSRIRGIYDVPSFITSIDSFISVCLSKASDTIASDVISSSSQSETNKEYARDMRKCVVDILNHYVEKDVEHNDSDWYKLTPRNVIGGAEISRVDTLENIIRRGSSNSISEEQVKDLVLSKACDIIINAVDLLSISGYSKMDIHKAIMNILQNREAKTNDEPSHPFEVTFVEGDPDNFDFVRVRDKSGREIRLSRVSKVMVAAISYGKNGRLIDSKCFYIKALKGYLLECGVMKHNVDNLIKDILKAFEKGGN